MGIPEVPAVAFQGEANDVTAGRLPSLFIEEMATLRGDFVFSDIAISERITYFSLE